MVCHCLGCCSRFLQAVCSSWCPANSIKALKASYILATSIKYDLTRWKLKCMWSMHMSVWQYISLDSSHNMLQLQQKTRSTGTVHASAKVRLTSAAIWWISMSCRFMSVNHFPYLSKVTNPKIPVSRWWSNLPPKFNHLFISQLPTFPETFMQIRLEVFCPKLLTNRKTNNDANISSLAEIIRRFKWIVGLFSE